MPRGSKSSMRIMGQVRCTMLRGRAGERDTPLAGEDLERALRDGCARTMWTRHNLIVNQGMQALATFLGNNLGAPVVGGLSLASISDITIGAMHIGDTVSPATPLATDTSDVGSLVYVPPITVSYPGGGFYFQVAGVIPTGECNGLSLTEEALLLQNGLVFAKAVFAPQAKTSAYGLQFTHEIAFTGN